MAQSSYTAQVAKQIATTKARMLAVRNEAAQRTVERMQEPVGAGGNMPVDTGFLRASLQAGIGDVQFSVRENPGGDAKHSFDLGEVSLVIASADLSDTITAVYTANYARHQEYGARGREGRGFVRLAAQQWPRIVEEVVAEVKARTGG